jgi:hypothetical protein
VQLNIYWTVGFAAASIAVSMIVGWLAYRGARDGVRQSIADAQRARAQEITVEHARWLRDRRAETYEAVVVQVAGRIVIRDIRMRHVPTGPVTSHEPTPIMPIDVLYARLSLYGTDDARRLVDLSARIDKRLQEIHNNGVSSDEFDRILEEAKSVDSLLISYLSAESAQPAIPDAPAKYDLRQILLLFERDAMSVSSKLATL